ncbi:MAG: MFS transporter, partial [Dialister sp.]|nr:MFS transporter [Dialister sp.]
MLEKSLEELEFEETGVTRKERWKVMWASIVGYAMDGLDVLILSFAMAAIVAEFGLTLGEGGLIATYTLIGTVLGGYLFGVFADYFGRVHTFALTIIIFSIFTGACAFADNVMHLNILRFLAGLGLGGEYGIGMTLVTETWPAAKRARATAGVAIGWQAGAVLAAILAAVVLPDYGWRGLFLVGVIPALLAAWARHGLKEPPMWLKRKELKKQLKERKAAGETLTAEEEAELAEASKFPLAHLFSSSSKTMTTISLTVMTSVQNFGYYGIMVWLPMILLKEHGLSTKSMSGWMVVTVIGMIAGIYVFGYLS